MLTTSNIRNRYEKIQKQLFYMIPEKWDRVYLYASIIQHFNHLQTGEMFFYYYPKSVFKKNPVNVYEVPSKFNLDEKAYLKLAEKLYDEIKKLQKELVKMGEKPWTNVTITIENFKFNVEYNYDDLVGSRYTSYDRHLIWRYQYLDIPLSSYTKKERQMIDQYIKEQQRNKKKTTTYQEGIYKKPISSITEYEKQEEIEKSKEETWIKEDEKEISPKEGNIETNNKEKENIKSQILNINF